MDRGELLVWAKDNGGLAHSRRGTSVEFEHKATFLQLALLGNLNFLRRIESTS